MSKLVSTVNFRISIAIIEHFSKNLYRSPNKAIEELVTNGYDAFAEEVRVYLPGAKLKDSVVVWDDGDSMDVQGIKDLWHVAASPKKGTERVVTKDNRRREVIGKFGIGKLASYSIGHKISHLCKRDNRHLLVEIDYRELTRQSKNKENGKTNAVQGKVLHNSNSDSLSSNLDEDKEQEYSENIYELTEIEATNFVSDHFVVEGNTTISDFFEKNSWTLAVISELKSVSITPGRLSRVLGRSMPLRPDFRVFVDDDEVKSVLLGKEALETFDFGSESFKTRLDKLWKSNVDSGSVEGDLSYERNSSVRDEEGNEIPYVVFPNLGKVWGKLRLSAASLHEGNAIKIDRYYGFFVYVRGRLINPEDDKLYLSDPSYASFYRAQYIIHADELDDVLLADRERFGDSNKLHELKLLQTACYRTVDGRWESEVIKSDEEKQFKNRIPIHRRDLFADPISMLWAKKIDETGEVVGSFDFEIEEPSIERTSLGADEPVAKLEMKGKEDKPRLTINDDHPFIKRQIASAGTGLKGAGFIREIENLMAMESLFEGHLYFLDLPREKISAILSWRDRMYRQLATMDNTTVFGAIQEMEDASYVGDREFESAINTVLQLIGFQSRVIGNSGNPDIVALAPAGDKSYRIVFEAKGSKKNLPNTRAAIASGVSHAKDYEAEHAVVIAREFIGFDLNDTPAIIKECLAINQTRGQQANNSNPILDMQRRSENPTVSIITTKNLANLATAVLQFQYDVLTIKSVLTEIETPSSKNERIKSLANPDYGFDFGELLCFIFEEQQKTLRASLATIFDTYYSNGEKGIINETEFKEKIDALHVLAFPFVPLSENRIAITQSPEMVLQHITRKLEDFRLQRANSIKDA